MYGRRRCPRGRIIQFEYVNFSAHDNVFRNIIMLKLCLAAPSPNDWWPRLTQFWRPSGDRWHRDCYAALGRSAYTSSVYFFCFSFPFDFTIGIESAEPGLRCSRDDYCLDTGPVKYRARPTEIARIGPGGGNISTIYVNWRLWIVKKDKRTDGNTSRRETPGTHK